VIKAPGLPDHIQRGGHNTWSFRPRVASVVSSESLWPLTTAIIDRPNRLFYFNVHSSTPSGKRKSLGAMPTTTVGWPSRSTFDPITLGEAAIRSDQRP